MRSFCVSPVFRQYLVIITANLSVVTIGFNLGWSSPVLVKLNNETQTVLDRPLTDDEGSWIVSIGTLTGLLVNFVIGLLMDTIGRKTCIIVGFLPRLVTCFMLLFATEVWVLLLGRAIDGLSNIFFMVGVPTYVSEIAGKDTRGALGTIFQVAVAIGMLVFLGVGPFLAYFELHLMYVCFVAVAIIPMLFIPETPYYLYSKGRKEETLKILTYLRGSEALAIEEIKTYPLSETKMSKKEIFKDRTTLKTVAKMIVLAILMQLIGYNAIMLYMQTILQSTQTSVRDEVASIMVGCIQLFACLCTILMTDRFGRKPILITTLTGMAVGLIGLGTFFQLQYNGFEISGFLNFLPLLSMLLIIYCYNAGMGSILWPLLAELFEGPARAVAMSIGIGVATVCVFITTRYFIDVIRTIGAASTYWIFSFVCIITAAFIQFCIPETKGKTFAEIQVDLGRPEKTETVK